MPPARLSCAFMIAALLMPAAPAIAATVKTERIQVDPPEAELPTDGPTIPTHDAEPEQQRGESATSVDPDAPLPQIHYGTDGLPAPVARMRDQMLEAAYSGDIERMRMVLESNEVMPTLSFGDPISDPIEFLRSSSGDPEGVEILAILTELLEAGWVHVDEGTPQEMYIWPYFARYPFSKLTPQQKVEMYRIVTASDVAEMESFGAWVFYRVGIGPDGTLHYFVAGD